MKNNVRIIDEELINWLLGKSNPSIRYFTLRDLLAKTDNASGALCAKQAIAEYAPIKKILSKQNADGSWSDPSFPYLPKYKASYWQIMTLAQLGLDRYNFQVSDKRRRLFDIRAHD